MYFLIARRMIDCFLVSIRTREVSFELMVYALKLRVLVQCVPEN